MDADLRERISANRQAAAAEAAKITELQLRAEAIRQQFQADVRRWRVIKGIDPPETETDAAADPAEEVSTAGTDSQSEPPGAPDDSSSG